MKEIIQELISEGRTEEALAKLAQATDEAILLLSRYNSGKKQYNMGLIEFSEWSRVQAQLNYAALEMAGTLKAAPAGIPAPENSGGAAAANSNTNKRVFISYNHKDGFVMRAVKQALSDAGINVHVDMNDLSAGNSIQGFIDDAFRNNDIVLSIISRNSLLSGWVNREMTVARVMNTFNKNWIPVSIDDACFNNEFVFEAQDTIDKKITELRNQIKRAIESDLDISAFTEELKRNQDLKSSIVSNIAELKSLFVVDIRNEVFDAGMSKVVQKIKAETSK